MKLSRIIAPLTIAAAGAAALAAALSKKAEKPAAEAPAPVEEKPAVAKALKSGTYSFVSGFADAKTVDVEVNYDENLYFVVVEDGFLTDTNVSHIALLSAEKFSLQLEYAEYYQGEGFEETAKTAAERYQSFTEVTFGANSGIRYLDGDCVCFAFPIENVKDSYLLYTLVKNSDNDDSFEKAAEYPEIIEIMENFSVTVTE